MKTLQAILSISAVALLYGIGAFVTPGTQVSAELVTLTDTTLAQRVGGPWTSVIAVWGDPSQMPSCSLSNCTGQGVVRHDRYKCVPCNDSNASAYTQIDAAEQTKYWCVFKDWKGVRSCKTHSRTIDWMRHCDNYQGACGS